MSNLALHAPDRDGRQKRAPDDRQAAIFGIHDALLQLDLQRWSWTVMDWLGLYDGFEQYLPVAEDPVLSVARVFSSSAKRPLGDRVRPGDILRDIETQSFMYWHAQWLNQHGDPAGPPWKPLDGDSTKKFWTYLEQVPQGAAEVRTQRFPMMHVDSAKFRNWLMAGWLRFSRPAPM